MTRFAPLIVVLMLHAISSASDWIIPDPVTYKWTVEQTQQEIPRVEFENTSIRDAIAYLGSSMVYPIRLQHELPNETLDKRVSWNLTKIKWIEVVARIADAADADIVIGKRIVTLKQRKPAEQSSAPGGVKPSN